MPPPPPFHHLGPAGTFSEQAARQFSDDLSPQPSFAAIAAAVAGGRGDGLLPYYNLLEGLVQESIDAIFEHQLTVVDATRLPITLAVGGSGDVVRSHPKALAQCGNWLTANAPGARQEPVASTADAARIAAETGGMAIARREALEATGLNVVADDIGNRFAGRGNFTDFLLVTADDAPTSGDAGRTLIAAVPDEERPGLLADLLRQFAFHRLNIAKIHSRPALVGEAASDIEPQMFYLEVMAAHDDEALVRCVEAITWHFRRSPDAVRVLGSWPDLTR